MEIVHYTESDDLIEFVRSWNPAFGLERTESRDDLIEFVRSWNPDNVTAM